MKLRCIGEVDIRRTPSEKKIKIGDIIDEPSLVKLLKEHPMFEVVEEPKPRRASRRIRIEEEVE